MNVARCTVSRLMGAMGLQGAVRGKGFKTLDDCAQSMRKLQDDVSLRRELDGCGRAAASQKWTQRAHLARHLEIIKELGSA